MNSKAPDHDGIIAAAELACGLLWMMADHRHPHTRIAFVNLLDALGGPGSEGLGRAIQRAIDAGYEADHPPSAKWWAGKKPEEKAPADAGTDATAALRAFAQEVFDYFDLSSFGMEGSELQEIAEKHGLLRQERRHEPCGKECRCEWEAHFDGDLATGVMCYQRTSLLTGEPESTTASGHDELSRIP